MQFELNCDLKNHIEMFPVFQEYFRTHQPPALIIWGKYDIYFSVEEALCYKETYLMPKYIFLMAVIRYWKQILMRY